MPLAPTHFRALLVDETAPRVRIEQLPAQRLPDAAVILEVEYSALNYKDALAVSGRGKIVRRFPMVPGIDAAGRVIESNDPRYPEGSQVVATGWGIGERHWGGYAERMAVDPDWLVPLPDGLDARRAMLLGTAGLTAMLALLKLERAGIAADQGAVLVSGASGGVGAWAIALLAGAGYEVHALSGKPEQREWLRALGASEVLPREGFVDNVRPLGSTRWAAAVDNAGGEILSAILPQIRPEGAVAAIGLAAGMTLATTVAPFILRGVSLLGINSVETPYALRLEAWDRLARLPAACFAEIDAGTLTLDQLEQASNQMIEGKLHGRRLVVPG